jgi:xanthine dehydrogenase YagR molybdenum-binding subunit
MARLVKTQVELEGRYEDRWVLVEEESLPVWPANDELRVVGKPAIRVTGPKRVSGAARFVSDIGMPGLLHGAVLRSPHAHARVELDVEAALAEPGVFAVIAPDDGFMMDGRPLLWAEPEYAGQQVAAVAAEDAEAGARGLAALVRSWEELPFVVDLEEGLRQQRFTEDPEEEERGNVEAGFAAADVVVEVEYRTPAQIQAALEPHCAVAAWTQDELAVWVSTQGIYTARRELAEAFGLESERVHVTCEFMGGGFGGKQGATMEGMIAAHLARRAGRPVRVFNDRRAETLATGHRAATIQTYRIGARRDGTLTAIEATAVHAIGVHGWVMPVLVPAATLYRCANYHGQSFPVRLNLGFSNAFRAPGVMEGTFGFEQAMDELAQALELDPLELRRRNEVDIDQQSGNPYTSKRLAQAIARAEELAGWKDRDALAAAEHPDGRRRALGAACQIWWGGGGPPAHALVRMGSDGLATVVTGVQDIGTGVSTAFAQVAAEELGLTLDRVRVEIGTTRYGVYAPVSGGSQTTPSMTPAVRSAAYEVRQQLQSLASDLFEVSADDLEIVDGEIRSKDGALRRPLVEVTGKLGNAQLVGTGSRGPNPDGMRIQTFGCQIAQVAVDPDTGEIEVERVVAVHDIGRVVNPLGASSQVEGGILQGLGFALSEERVVDPTTGTVVNGGLEDYKPPTMADCPEIVLDFIDVPDEHIALGVKGLGEPPIVPTAAAIANAVAAATGVRIREAPLSRRRFLESLDGSGVVA